MQTKIILFYGFKLPKEFNEKYKNFYRHEDFFDELNEKLETYGCFIRFTNDEDDFPMQYAITFEEIQLSDENGVEKFTFPKEINTIAIKNLKEAAKELNIKIIDEDIGWYWFIKHE